MDAHNHGFIQDEVDLNGLLNNPAAWSDQFGYQQQHVPDPYGRYSTNQPSFDQPQYDLSHQTSYSPVPYSNNQSFTPQYQQHARNPDVFTPASFNLESSLQDQPNSFHGVQNSFPFQQAPTQRHSAISPQNLQYSVLAQQQLNPVPQQLSNGVSSSVFQRPTSGTGNRTDYNFNMRQQSTPSQNQAHYFNQPHNGAAQQNLVQAPANNNARYSNGTPEIGVKHVIQKYVPEDKPSPAPASAAVVPSASRVAVEVKSIPRRNPLRVTHPELLDKMSSSRPRFEYAPFVVWEDTPLQVAPGLKSQNSRIFARAASNPPRLTDTHDADTIPKYHPRKSRSGQELVPGLPKSTMPTTPARISKKIRAPKEKTKHVSNYKGTGRSAFGKVSALRADGSSTPIKSPSTPTESSSSEEETSSEEESDYEDEDDEMPVPIDISTVREVTRPNDIPNAARWDAIGIVWKDPNSSPSGEAITSAIHEYANSVIAIRTKIKDLAAEIDEATKAKANESQIQKLKKKRAEKVEALYETIEAANKLGYTPIIDHLGTHHKFVNVLTGTLIEYAKAEDYLGKLPKAIFALMAKFHSLTDELLEKLKFKALEKRWNKKGDQETKDNIVTILANTTDAKERATQAEKTLASVEEKKKNLAKLELSKLRNAENAKATTTNPSKRAHDGDGSNGKPAKKMAVDLSSIKIAKRTTNNLANNLLGISSKPIQKPTPKAAPPPKKKDPSPPPTESKLGALLASIAKPPEPPKKAAPTPGPPETADEKKRRQRKESRRHLRVKFKEGSELEQIRLFKHEQAEDEGRQDNMLRDAHDDRSEGMMHKQRVLESMDEDDETLVATINDRPYPDLMEVELSNMNKSSRFGAHYVTRGGDVKFTTPEQQTQERREALELLVVYNDPSEIPSSAKEPAPANMDSTSMTRQIKPPATPWLTHRLGEIQTLGPDFSRQLFLARTGQNDAPSANVSTLLQQLGGAPQPQPLPSREQAALFENLGRIVASLTGKPYPPIEPPEWNNEAQKKDWWDGYNRDKAIKDKKIAEERVITQMQTPQPQPAPPMVQTPMPVPQMTFQPEMIQPSINYSQAPPAPDVSQQVANFFSNWSNENTNTVSQPQQQSPAFDFSAWSNVPGLQQYTQTPSAPPTTSQRWDGRNEETSGQDNQEHYENRNQYQSQNQNQNPRRNRKGAAAVWKDGGGPLDENGEYRGKKKPCRFFLEGKCAKGKLCTFLHE